MPELHSIDKLLEKLKELHEVNCVKGIDYPCVTCLECPEANYQEYSLDKDIILKWTTNSAIVSIKLPLRDYLDEVLHRELLKELSRRLKFVLDKPEEGYHISLFIKHTDVNDPKTFEQIEKFLKKDLMEIMSMITHGRVMIKDWARYVTNKLHSLRTD